jgi:cell division protease FtsH
MGGGHDEKEQTLNQLLAEMDGFDTTAGRGDPGRDQPAGGARPRAAARPAASTARCWSTGRTTKGRVADPQVHVQEGQAGAGRRPRARWPHSRPASPAPTWPTWSTRRRCWPPGAADAVTMEDFTGAMERIVAGLEKKNRVLNPH